MSGVISTTHAILKYNYFQKIKCTKADDKNENKVKCNCPQCGQTYASTTSTTILINHLKTHGAKHADNYNAQVLYAPVQLSNALLGGKNGDSTTRNNDSKVRDTAWFYAMHGISYRVAEKPPYRRMTGNCLIMRFVWIYKCDT